METGFKTETFSLEMDAARYAAEYTDAERFLSLCKSCPFYGTAWSCPPFEEDARGIWKKYRIIRLLARKIILSEELLSRTYTAEELSAFSAELLKPFKAALCGELLQAERENPKSMALFPGRCELCAVCARKAGESCRFPERMRPSPEALGADLGRTVSLFPGQSLLWGKDGHLPEYYFLIGALLLP